MSQEYILQGKLTPENLENLFDLLKVKNLMGTLYVSDEFSQKIIYFSMGGIRLITTGKPRVEKMGELMLQRDLINQKDLDRVLDIQKEQEANRGKKQRLGDILVERNIVSREEIKEIYSIQLGKEMEDLFTWPEADYKFSEGNPSEEFYDPEYQSVSMTFDLGAFLERMRGKQKELAKIVRAIDSDSLVFEREEKVPNWSSVQESSEIIEEEKRVFALVDGEKRVKDIAEIVDLDNRVLYERLYSLEKKNFIRKVSQQKQSSIDRSRRKDEIAALEAALDKAVNKVRVQKKLAKLYEEEGDREKASEYYAVVGDLMAKKDPQQAVKSYEEAARLNPKNLPLHKKIFNFYLNSNRKADAVKQGKKYAQILKKFGFLNRARELFSQLVQISPADPQIRQDYADNLLELHRDEEALEQMEVAANIFEKKDNSSEYLRVLERMKRVDEDDPRVQKKILSARGQKFKALLSLDPWTVSQVAMVFLLLVATAGFIYEFMARNYLLEKGEKIRNLIREKKFGQAEEIIDQMRTSYTLSSITQSVLDLEKEWKKAKKTAGRNEQFSTLKEALNLEVAGKLQEARQIYNNLRFQVKDKNLATIVERRRAKLEKRSLEAQKLSRELKAIMNRSHQASDQELKKAYELARKLKENHPHSIFSENLTIPLKVTTVPPGGDIYLNGKYQDSAPWIKTLPLSKFNQTLEIKQRGFPSRVYNLDKADSNIFRIYFTPPHKKYSLHTFVHQGCLNSQEKWFLLGGHNLQLLSLENFQPLTPPQLNLDSIDYPLVMDRSTLWVKSGDKIHQFQITSRSMKKEKTHSLPASKGQLLASLPGNRFLLSRGKELLLWNPATETSEGKWSLKGKIVGRARRGELETFFATSNSLYQFDHKTGKLSMLYKSTSDILHSPTVDGDRIYLGTREGLVALFKKEDFYKEKSLRSFRGGIQFIAPFGKRRVIALSPSKIYCLDPRRQEISTLWESDLPHEPTAPPRCREKDVYICLKGGKVFAYQLKEEMISTKIKGHLKWALNGNSSIVNPVEFTTRGVCVYSQKGDFYMIEER